MVFRVVTPALVLLGVLVAGMSFSAEREITLTVVSPESPYTIQVLPFELGVPPEQVTRLALRLQGTFNNQFFLCGSPPYETRTVAGRVALSLGDDVHDSQDILIIHPFPSNPGDPLPFDFTEILVEGGPGGWAFLDDGSSQIGIADYPYTVYDDNALPCFPGNVFGTLAGATLIVTFDPDVPVESRSWDAVKSLYR